MSDLFDAVNLQESLFEWGYATQDNVMNIAIRLPTSIFPPGVRIPAMVCKLQISRTENPEDQIIFLQKNTLFKPSTMSEILDFLSEHAIEV